MNIYLSSLVHTVEKNKVSSLSSLQMPYFIQNCKHVSTIALCSTAVVDVKETFRSGGTAFSNDISLIYLRFVLLQKLDG
jgi:hypothetical protein